MESKQAAVLEISGSKVVCLAASIASGKFQVDGFTAVPCRGLNKGAIRDEEEVGTAALHAIQKVEKELGEHIMGIAVNISGPHLQCSTSQGYLPIVPQGRILRAEDVLTVLKHSRQVLVGSDREQVSAVPREFRVDGQRGIADPVGLAANKLEVMTTMVTGAKKVIDGHAHLAARIGRRLDQIVVQPFASAFGCAPTEALDLGCAVIDVGFLSTDVAVYLDHKPVHCACLPIGAHHITSDIAYLLKTELGEAERVKVEHGVATPAGVSDNDVIDILQKEMSSGRPLKRRALAEIIEARVREIATYAGKEIEKSGVSGKLAGGIFITGGCAHLEGVELVFEKALSGRRVKPAAPKTTGPNSRRLMDPIFSTSVGMARMVLEWDQQEFEPVSGTKGWQDGFKAIQSIFGRRP